MTDEILTGELVPAETPQEAAGRPATLFRTNDPLQVLKAATDIANALAPVLKTQKMTHKIGNKEHIEIAGWQTLGSMLGVTPVGVWTKRLDNGWEAKVNAQTLDGRVIGSAEAMCVRDEKRWHDAEDYAIRSMAQTRAASKALASVLRFVVTLAGFEGTPAEEMDGVAPQRSSGSVKPSEKQIQFFERLARKGFKEAADAEVVIDYGAAVLTGGREGNMSSAIDALKEGNAEAMKALLDAAREWSERQTDVPADTAGLAPQDDLSDVPFA